MTPDPENGDVDQRLAELFAEHDALLERCLHRSAHRVAAEVQRLARSDQRLVPYLRASFHCMNAHQSLLDPEIGREQAVALIALLESPDRARLLQPDFPEAGYEETVAWMSACAYDNLATATALAQGYNSEGMHGCITDGLQVCRRTGKLQCLTCFREYATDVYTAADDLDLALHHARSVATQPPLRSSHDRRWVGAHDEAQLLLLRGDLAAAEAAARQALTLGPLYHNPLAARLSTHNLLDSILLLAGRDAEVTGKDAEEPPAGECPEHEYDRGLRDALAALCRNDAEEAFRLLAHWDRWLTEHGCLHHWFEVRLRLIAAHRLAGRGEKVPALARQLEERARRARDWLTLRRLGRLLDPQEPASPMALLAPLSTGPFAAPGSVAPAALPPTPEANPEEPAGMPPEAPPSPLQETWSQFLCRLDWAEYKDSERAAVLRDLLAIPPTSVAQPADALRFLELLLHYLVHEGVKAADVWPWAEAVAAPFAQVAEVLNLLAFLGHQLIILAGSGAGTGISRERIEQLFHRSLDLDPNSALNHARAGNFYLNGENFSEAERCLARGFRLARNDTMLALRLAEVYDRTERPRDALAVLDMCLREGNEAPPVAWAAAMSAYQLEQYDSLLTYLDRFESLQPDQPEVFFFRATALLELDRPLEALAVLEREEQRGPKHRLAVEALRACAAAALERVEDFERHLAAILQTPLATVDYLTVNGLTQLLTRLWQTATGLPAKHPLRAALEERLVVSGLAPNELFTERREASEEREQMNVYRCLLRQPLDERWPHAPGCLAAQESWRSYIAPWVILAGDEDEAARLALSWQERCYPLPARVVGVEMVDDGYTDKPGVISQGFRWEEEAEAEGAPS